MSKMIAGTELSDIVTGGGDMISDDKPVILQTTVSWQSAFRIALVVWATGGVGILWVYYFVRVMAWGASG